MCRPGFKGVIFQFLNTSENITTVLLIQTSNRGERSSSPASRGSRLQAPSSLQKPKSRLSFAPKLRPAFVPDQSPAPEEPSEPAVAPAPPKPVATQPPPAPVEEPPPDKLSEPAPALVAAARFAFYSPTFV